MPEFRFDIPSHSKLCGKSVSHGETFIRGCGNILSPEAPYRCDLEKGHELKPGNNHKMHHCCGANWEINW